VRTVVLNDTSDWHAGSAAATGELLELLEQAGHQIVGKLETHQPHLYQSGKDLLERLAPGLIVVHGEGTMNHNAETATILLGLAAQWKATGAAVFLVNALWQGMAGKWARLVGGFDRVFTRDPESARLLEAEGVEVLGVRVDLSVNVAENLEEGLGMLPERFVWTYGDCVTGRPLPWIPPGARPVSLRKLGWMAAIRAIRMSEIYFTGEHHGAIAAALAGVPFAAMEPGTHKLRELFKWAGTPGIPLARHAGELEEAARWAFTPDGRREQDRFAAWLRLEAPRLSSDELEI
jgi:hypothetical protein